MKFVNIDMDTFKVGALRQIDEAAENARLKHITPGSGQALVYEEKYRQAKLHIDEAENDPALIGMVIVDADLYGYSVTAAAQEIINKAEQWRAVSSQIERKRLMAKNAVKAATTADQVRQAIIVDWNTNE